MKKNHDVHLYTPLINQFNERNCCHYCCNEVVHHLPRRNRFSHRQSLLIGIFMGFVIAVSTLCTIGLSIATTTNYRDDIVTAVTSGDTRHIRGFKSEMSSEDESTTFLYDKVRILCMVFTHEENFVSKARLVNETWGRRCNKLLFLANTTDANQNIETTILNVTESRAELWGKTKAGFKLAYDQYLNNYDWFLKADDDTYVILENLRYFLYPYPSDMALYFGYKFKRQYMSGGAGYVLSRKSLEKFITEALPNKENCTQDSSGDEDYEMGKCLRSVGVPLGDSRDEMGKERFSPLPPNFLLNPDQNKTFWYYTYAAYEEKPGLECCSDTAISFHYIYGTEFYVLEYFIYHLKPVNRWFKMVLPKKYSTNEVKILLEASINLENDTANLS